jgi:hypothetical protein
MKPKNFYRDDRQTTAKEQEILVGLTDFLLGTSQLRHDRTAVAFLEILGVRLRNPNTRSAYRVTWRSFLAYCSKRQLELESVKAYHVGAWISATAFPHFRWGGFSATISCPDSG